MLPWLTPAKEDLLFYVGPIVVALPDAYSCPFPALRQVVQSFPQLPRARFARWSSRCTVPLPHDTGVTFGSDLYGLAVAMFVQRRIYKHAFTDWASCCMQRDAPCGCARLRFTHFIP